MQCQKQVNNSQILKIFLFGYKFKKDIEYFSPCVWQDFYGNVSGCKNDILTLQIPDSLERMKNEKVKKCIRFISADKSIFCRLRIGTFKSL